MWSVGVCVRKRLNGGGGVFLWRFYDMAESLERGGVHTNGAAHEEAEEDWDGNAKERGRGGDKERERGPSPLGSINDVVKGAFAKL